MTISYTTAYNILTIDSTVAWSPHGAGWIKLGFLTYYPTRALAAD